MIDSKHGDECIQENVGNDWHEANESYFDCIKRY